MQSYRRQALGLDVDSLVALLPLYALSGSVRLAACISIYIQSTIKHDNQARLESGLPKCEGQGTMMIDDWLRNDYHPAPYLRCEQ